MDSFQAKVVRALSDYVHTVAIDMQHMLSRYTIADVCHRVVGVGPYELLAVHF